jgi:hypothetical protein
MGKTVHINLEDMPDGTVAFQVQYPGGFDPKSNAHQGALILTKYMDSIAQPIGKPAEQVIGTGSRDGEPVVGNFKLVEESNVDIPHPSSTH